MSLEHKDSIMKLLRDHIDCLAWNYREMPSLSRELVEHRLQRVVKCLSCQMLENYCFFDDFTVQHVSRDENTVANNLAQ
jgi:hypothetical protein